MAGLDPTLFVLIHSTVETGIETVEVYGTGYLITEDLILTARHVVYEGKPKQIEVRLGKPIEGETSHWVEADQKPVWENEKYDTAVIRITKPVSWEVPLPDWNENDLEVGAPWKSSAYPDASAYSKGEYIEHNSSGLYGTLLKDSADEQVIPELELGVDYEAKWWNGISGSPVFMKEKLVGIIKTSLPNYGEKRLAATPVKLLLKESSFRLAIAHKWLLPFPQENWILVLKREIKYESNELEDTVKTAIHDINEAIKDGKLDCNPFHNKPYTVSVADALESSERFFQFIQAVCAAPVMLFDVTDTEPGVMLFLGIRAVVRRGVSLVATTKYLDASTLSLLPFNIQETKLIDLSEERSVQSESSIDLIYKAITEGLKQLGKHPDYLDLPAYNAVRCPKPEESEEKGNILVLCSFQEKYIKEYWDEVKKNIRLKANKKPIRMLDIPSPRLTGLALYESIRWSPMCVIDWTHWRANVFFELGVRLACSENGAICIMEESAGDSHAVNGPETADTATEGREETDATPVLIQKQQLIRLLAPIKYKLKGSAKSFTSFNAAFEEYEKFKSTPVNDSAIAPDAVYQLIIKLYHWKQELISKLPHEELETSAYALLGTDPQKQGGSDYLFSANPDFAKELRRNAQEKMIAAWYYLKGRYSGEFDSDKELRTKLIRLGGEVIQRLSKTKTPAYKKIYNEIAKDLEKFRSLS